MYMKSLLTGVLLWGAIVPCTQAAIVSASGNAVGNGTIDVTSNFNEADVTKVFSALNDPPVMLLSLDVDAPGFYAIKETITNLTGHAWDSFSWLMSNAEGVFFFNFADPPGTGPFANSTPKLDALSTASVFGGVLANGASMQVNLQVLVTGLPQDQSSVGFTIIQVPHPTTVPLPGALALFGLGGIPALFGMVRTRRA